MWELLFYFLAAPTSADVGSLSAADSAIEVVGQSATDVEIVEQMPTQNSVPTFFSDERPILTAQSALLYEVDKEAIVFADEMWEQRSVASLTKLMTALLVLESVQDLDTVVKVDRSQFNLVDGVYILPNGGEFTVRELLHALLIKSANDAAYVLAIHHSGSVDAFVEQMNLRARELGMYSSRFANPAGFDGLGNYSSARDMLLLALAVWDYPVVAEISRKTTHDLMDVSGNWRRQITSTNQLLGTDYPFVGLKTGTTPEAGQAFIGITEETEPRIVIVLGSRDRFQDIKLLWEWGTGRL